MSSEDKAAEKMAELEINENATEAGGKSPKGSRKEAQKESKLASLARRSRSKPGKDTSVDLITRFTEGVFFKAKVIGVEDVPEARGDNMCQISLTRLKAMARNSGEHKTRVSVCVSVEGLKIREEKTADLLYHHPVHRISFISQDSSDSRAFGYVYGSPDIGHKFYALKTEKQARSLIIAMRDLFQVVYDMKKQEIDMAREHRRTLDQQQLAEQLPPQVESSPDSPEAPAVVVVDEPSPDGVEDLLNLESELDNLRKGISQMDTSISAQELKKSEEELDNLFADPFGDSFRPQQASQPAAAATTSGPEQQKSPFGQQPFAPAPQQSSASANNQLLNTMTTPPMQQAFTPNPVQQSFSPNPMQQSFGFGSPSFGPGPQQSQAFNAAPIPQHQQQPFGGSPASQIPQQQPFGGSPAPQFLQQQPFGGSPAPQFPQQQPFGGVPAHQSQAFAGGQFPQANDPFQANGTSAPQPGPFHQQPAMGTRVQQQHHQQATNPFGASMPSNNPFAAPSGPGSVNVLDTMDQTNQPSADGIILSPEKPVMSSDLVNEPGAPTSDGGNKPVDVLAALDPLGANKQHKHKQQFFKELKPQKKALKDLSGAQQFMN